MLVVSELFKRINFWRQCDRIGPDIITQHWRLYFSSTMRRLCLSLFADFKEGAEFRPGSYAHSCSKISIGKNVVVRPGSFISADPRKGGGSIIIEDDVLLGPCLHVYTNNHSFRNSDCTIINQGYPPAKSCDSVIIKNGAWIGANVTLLPGVTVGENSVIGAGSTVTKSVLSRVVVAGNPARIIKNI